MVSAREKLDCYYMTLYYAIWYRHLYPERNKVCKKNRFICNGYKSRPSRLAPVQWKKADILDNYGFT